MSSHVRGREAELVFAAHCLSLGIIHLEPTTTGLPYDAMIEVHGKLFKVQVKRAFRRRGPRGKEFTGARWVATIKRSREQPYKEGDAHFFAIVVGHERVYMVPWTVMNGQREIAVNMLPSAYWLTEKWLDDMLSYDLPFSRAEVDL